MPALPIQSNFLTSALIALVVGLNCLPGYAEDKAPWVGETLEGEECIGRQGFGPFDYLRRAQFPAELEVVERAHFTPGVEQLDTGRSSYPINDIDYTIKAWPNHHRALHSAMKYRMMHWDWPEDAKIPPAECQMQRAIKFSPNDPIPYMMYGLLLHKSEQYDKALLAYRSANRLRPDDILTLYNMGLTLVELEQFDEAVQVAKTAYAAGMPLPGLKNKLIAAGQWQTAAKASETDKAAPKVELEAPEEPSEETKQSATGGN